MLYPLTARQDAGAPAFTMCRSREVVTFGQLEARSNQAAHVFRACGVRRGEHVALLMRNERGLLETCFGAERAGLYYTTMSTRLTAGELAFIVRDCAARVLLVSSSLAEVAAQLRPMLPAGIRCFLAGEPSPGWEEWDSMVAAMPVTPIADEAQGSDMLYSSGTTGRPKGVQWPLLDAPAGARTFLVELLERLFGYGPECRYLCPAPLYHAAPLRHSMTTIKLGGSVFVMEHFDAESALALIQEHRITHSQWVPTMFVRMLKLPREVRERYDVSSMRVAVHAAAPCPVEVKERMIAWWGPVLHEYYAGTENNGFCAITTEEWLRHRGSVGRAVQGTLHVCDEGGVEVPTGETGIVYFADGPEFRYHNDPERTAQARNARGWSTLGDVGKVDEEGYLYLVDRKAFTIISGGVNVYPQEVEDVLVGHPDVLDAAVFGVPNEDLGEEVKAIVQPVASARPDRALEAALIAYCRERLASYKCPRTIEFMVQLPRHPTGKLHKKALRDRYWLPGAHRG